MSTQVTIIIVASIVAICYLATLFCNYISKKNIKQANVKALNDLYSKMEHTEKAMVDYMCVMRDVIIDKVNKK